MCLQDVNAAIGEVKSLENDLLTSLAAAQGQNVLNNVTETKRLSALAEEYDQALKRYTTVKHLQVYCVCSNCYFTVGLMESGTNSSISTRDRKITRMLPAVAQSCLMLPGAWPL